jgi:hypothetical protein
MVKGVFVKDFEKNDASTSGALAAANGKIFLLASFIINHELTGSLKHAYRG